MKFYYRNPTWVKKDMKCSFFFAMIPFPPLAVLRSSGFYFFGPPSSSWWPAERVLAGRTIYALVSLLSDPHPGGTSVPTITLVHYHTGALVHNNTSTLLHYLCQDSIISDPRKPHCWSVNIASCNLHGAQTTSEMQNSLYSRISETPDLLYYCSFLRSAPLCNEGEWRQCTAVCNIMQLR